MTKSQSIKRPQLYHLKSIANSLSHKPMNAGRDEMFSSSSDCRSVVSIILKRQNLVRSTFKLLLTSTEKCSLNTTSVNTSSYTNKINQLLYD